METTELEKALFVKQGMIGYEALVYNLNSREGHTASSIVLDFRAFHYEDFHLCHVHV